MKSKNNRHQRHFATGTDVVQSTALAAHTNQSSPQSVLVGSSPVLLLFVFWKYTKSARNHDCSPSFSNTCKWLTSFDEAKK